MNATLRLTEERVADPAWVAELLARCEAHEIVARELNVETGEVVLSAASKSDVLAFDGKTLRAIYGPRWRLLLIGAGQLSRYVADMVTVLARVNAGVVLDIIALGQLDAADVQSVLAPIKVVVARQAPGFHRRGACPLQLVHAKRHADVQGQHQLGGGRGWLGTLRAAQWRDLHPCGQHFAQLQPAVQQGRQLPAQAQVGHFDGQAGAAPAQPADAPAAAQRAGGFAAFQLLLGGQVLRGARSRVQLEARRCLVFALGVLRLGTAILFSYLWFSFMYSLFCL